MDDATGVPPPRDRNAATEETLARVGDARGFHERIGDQHSALFVRGKGTAGGTLIVTFENLDHVRENTDDGMPWGYGFVTARGWSLLGLMAHGWTWYRDEAVLDFFDRLRDEGFFAGFDRVVFYGASMGAYAAAAFSAAAPGSVVVAISPQATLARDIAAWETRYRRVWRRDFSGRYGYAPDMAEHARQVYLFFDPYEPLDAMHAALFRGENVKKLPCRRMGHRIASLWMQMKVLKPIFEDCVEGRMTDRTFHAYMRQRRETPRFQRGLLATLKARNRPGLVLRYCTAVTRRRRAPLFRREIEKARQALGQVVD
jgi:pimeloyl-ACP methyl ester carboxylesterase